MTTNRWIRRVCVLCVMIVAGLPAAADQYPRQPGIKILKYSFDVTVGDASDEITVADTIDLQFLADGVRSLDLDLCNLITSAVPPDRLNPCLVVPPRPRRGEPQPPAPSSVGKGMTVTAVLSAGQPLTYEHRNDRVHITFPTPSHAGEKFTFTVSYHGVPAAGLFIGKNRYGDRVFFTDNWPNRARNWLATIDHISIKAPKTVRVMAPSHYQVISNGALKEQVDLPGDLRRTVWEESQPIPSWQFSLGVAQMAVEHFGREREVPLSAWMFPQNREAGWKAVDPLTQSVFEFYRDHIGPYVYEKLAQVEATGAGGATEPASTIFYYGGFGPLSHEMAHQWFGDMVTESDWDDAWLSEGFATYFALLYTEHQDGRDAFVQGVRRTREVAIKYALAHPSDTVVHDNLAHDSDVFFNGPQIYQGGAMVLHMLRGVLGDQIFWAGIRLYSSRFRNGSATSEDFRHAMEDACQASGQCPAHAEDLSWFFREWLHRGGILQLNGSWHYDAAAKLLRITMDETQTQGLYQMPVQVGITLPAPASATPGSAGAMPQVQIVSLWLDQQHNTLDVPLAAAPTEVQLDPDLWLPMMQAEFKPER